MRCFPRDGFPFPFPAIVLAVGVILSGCARSAGPDKADPANRRLRVVTTTGMIADAVRAVAGDRAEVTALMGAGVDPHLFRASEGDVRRLGDADIVFHNGLHLEAKLGEVLGRMRGRVRTVAVGEAVPGDRLIALPGGRGQHDPHIWFDVSIWMLAVERIRDAFADADPARAAAYRDAAQAYLRDLAELHDYARRRITAIPAGQRVLVTAHDAFHYFGRAYGLEVRGLQGVSTASEAGARDVSELAAYLAERRIPAIFVESSVPRRNIEAVIEAAGARGHRVRIGAELFSDAMGSPGTPEGTYTGMVRHNVDAIAGALGGGAK